jgi:hypothetical protein
MQRRQHRSPELWPTGTSPRPPAHRGRWSPGTSRRDRCPSH